MDLLQQLLQDNEKWLMERILSYAKLHNFTKYTSTLLEAWRMSILGLTNFLCMSIRYGEKDPQFTPDENYISDPVTEFGRLEAKRHHERGISISMFLGLLKYYRDTYIDLIIEKGPQEFKQPWAHFILRSFDRFEIALCTEWITTDNSEQISRLEKANRRLSNEKNKYLTLFESTPHPVFLVDEDGLLDSMNLSAAHFLGLGGDSGEMYYSEGHSTIDRKAKGLRKPFESYLPWLKEDVSSFSEGDFPSKRLEIKTNFFGSNQYFEVFFAHMLDVSGKFSGILTIIDDITKRKELEFQLNYLATTDALTGANNRRRFLERSEDEVARAKRYTRPLSFLMLDIDHFKEINDTFGHAIGDDVLRALSSECQKLLRKTDIFGRVGGEEFAAILPETTLKVATQVAERMRQALAKVEIDGHGRSVLFTVSIGIVEQKDHQNLFDIMYFADKALYEAKKTGRNKVVVWNVKT